MVYEGTTAPSTNDASNWLWGFSTENFALGNNSNTSDIPTALSGYSAAMTTSTTETDNAYFANSSTAQSSVSVSGTKSELITLLPIGINIIRIIQDSLLYLHIQLLFHLVLLHRLLRRQI